MKVTHIQVENFLGFEIFKVDEFGKFNRITGDNGVGKSAILKAIKEAFKSSGVDPDLIKTGADKARILIRLDNGAEIDRRLTATTNNVKVNIDGSPKSSPQKWLDQICGPNSFNPVEFFLSKPKERRALILSAVPVKLDKQELIEQITIMADEDTAKKIVSAQDFGGHGLETLEGLKREVYTRRHDVGVSVLRVKKAIEKDKVDLPEVSEAERWKDFDQTKRTEDLVAAESAITQHENDVARLAMIKRGSEDLFDEIESLEHKIDKIKTQREKMIGEGKALKATVGSFNPPDIHAIREELEAYREYQKLAQMLDLIDKREAELDEITSEQAALDKIYKYLTNELPKKLLQGVEVAGFEGLEITGDGIYVKGVSIDKLSTKEQMTFAVRLARHFLGDLMALCVDRFESLSKKSRTEFFDEAAGDGVEYFITQVTDGPLKVEAETPE